MLLIKTCLSCSPCKTVDLECKKPAFPSSARCVEALRPSLEMMIPCTKWSEPPQQATYQIAHNFFSLFLSLSLSPLFKENKEKGKEKRTKTLLIVSFQTSLANWPS